MRAKVNLVFDSSSSGIRSPGKKSSAVLIIDVKCWMDSCLCARQPVMMPFLNRLSSRYQSNQNVLMPTWRVFRVKCRIGFIPMTS